MPVVRTFPVLTLLLSSIALAGEPKAPADPSLLSLERIFGRSEFKTKRLSARWLDQHPGYTFLRGAEAGALKGHSEIWHTLPGEEPRRLVSADELLPPGSEVPLSIDDYQFSGDLGLLLVYTNSQRVWRSKSRGDYWVLDRGSGELQQLGGDSAPSSLQFAKFAPDGSKVAYVRGNDLFVEDLLDQEIRQLTKSNKATLFHGRFDWVYEEELQIRDGFRWSPDGEAIAFWQFDESGVRQHTMVDHVSGLYPKLQQFGYPKVGQRNAASRIGIVELSTGAITWAQVPGDPRNHYLARMDWTNRADELIVQQLDRAQTSNRVMLVQRSDGAARTILKENDPAWVDIHDELHWLREGKDFTWISERDGWRHLFLVSRDGSDLRCLTPGEYDVIDFLGVDAGEEWAYFIASPGNPSQRFLYRVGLDGRNLTRVTPDRYKRGSHSYSLAPDGNHAIHTFSTTERPPVTTLVSLPDHEEIEVLEDNNDLRRKVKKLRRKPVEFFEVEIDEGISLPARCLLPPDFDPHKKYPLLVYVYGEPAGQTVRDSWGGSSSLWHLMLAQQGYVVMSFDNRGTNAPLGREWRKASSRKIGILGPADQAAAVRAVLEQRPYLDPERVGSWGWSGGGSSTLHALFKYPDLYRAGIAVASVPNQRHYDTIYQERYMGLPGENVEAYREGSPINFAHQLEGDLLLIHGAADDNCHYQTYLKLVDALVRHNKPFSMMTYPRGTHGIREGRNTTRHLYETMTRFLHQHLPPAP